MEGHSVAESVGLQQVCNTSNVKKHAIKMDLVTASHNYFRVNQTKHLSDCVSNFVATSPLAALSVVVQNTICNNRKLLSDKNNNNLMHLNIIDL